MKNSDAVKVMLLAAINEIAADPIKYAINPGKDFTRNRKLGFHNTLLMLLTMEADCIKEELYRYFGRNTDAPSKAAFYRQRCKLTNDALANLLYTFSAMLPKNLYNGKYQFIACDGSSVDIFRNPDDPDTFFEPNGKSTRGFNQIHINAFYSILDKRFTNLLVQPSRKSNEYAAFCEMVDATGSCIPKTVYFADMVYTSYNSFAHVIENGQFFLIQCNDKSRPYMMNYLQDERCSLSNNLSENSLRPLIVGRKNWLFSDTQDGAEAGMIIYSMIETAKANDIDPLKYLTYLLEHRPNAAMQDDELAIFAPWNENVQAACKNKESKILAKLAF